uniref:Uncharacterized protein n=1 Tax=Zea mays TaxID=4577 RepID=B6UFS8_MAIZE|nr:hypothetical protein [Zea mays]
MTAPSPVSPFGFLTAPSSPSHCCWRLQLLTIEQGATPRLSRRPPSPRRGELRLPPVYPSSTPCA